MFISSNPSTGKRIFKEDILSDSDLSVSINRSYDGFLINKCLSITDRKNLVKRLVIQLKVNIPELSKLITQEMGKPIEQSVLELEKCISLCEHYCEYAGQYLADQHIETSNVISRVCFKPLGVIVGVMPWNFPFWQVFRFAIPTFLAGNGVLIKHAPNVGMCANALSDLFQFTGLGDFYRNICISTEQFKTVIESKSVRGVSLTGSCLAGSVVGALASKNLKPQILELGGSDVFIVNDALDLSLVVREAVKARLQNNGQSCIAAKRFLINEDLVDRFITILKEQLSDVVIGDPSSDETNVGPLARKDLMQEFNQLVVKGKEQGAKLIFKKEHAQSQGFYTDISVYKVTETDNCLMQEEVFGPCFVIKSFFNIDEAINIANDSCFGLSSSVWTDVQEIKEKCIEQIEAGAVFINQVSKSDASLPFGGIKDSGIGRELGEEGIKAFVNKKLIVE